MPHIYCLFNNSIATTLVQATFIYFLSTHMTSLSHSPYSDNGEEKFMQGYILGCE